MLYTWSLPTYRQFNYPLTARFGNETALGELITYQQPLNTFPWIPQMFGLYGNTNDVVLAQLKTRNATVWAQATSEQRVLAYGLSQLPSQPYDSAGAPPLLVRGGGRNVAFFCNQFSTDYGLSVDECIAKYFAPGSVLQVFPNWSTSSDKSIVAHYTGAVLYTILPNHQSRTGWQAKYVVPFSVEQGNDEWLYAANSRFAVISAECSPFHYWNVTLLELNPGDDSTRSLPNKQMPLKTCANV